MEILFLGTGTSHGVPMIGCNCKVCNKARMDRKYYRTRCSILIKTNGKNILIDTSQDFRTQMLENNIKRIDIVLFTHNHADHIFGLPDIRSYNYLQKEEINCYASKDVVKYLRTAFGYIFNPKQVGGGIPKIKLNIINSEFTISGIKITPLPVKHGILNVFGYRIKDIAYVPDVNYIPEQTMNKMKNLKVLILDGLHDEKHPTHFNTSQAIEIIKRLKPEKAYLTHLTHRIDYQIYKLPENIYFPFDNQIIKV